LRAHGTTQDITARKNAELALRKAQEDLDRFFNFLPDLACVATTDGRFLKLNPRWKSALGHPEPELLERPYLEWIHPEDLDRTRQAMARQAEGQAVLDFVNRYRTRDGSYRWLEWSSSPLIDGKIFAVARDITERRRMDEALKDMEKLSAKGQMAAYIAHEINNPLAGIKNAFTLVERAIPPDHANAKYADLIKREIDRIAGIIRTMYHVYRPPSREVKAVSLQQAFRDIGDLVESKCRATDVHLCTDLEDPSASVTLNEGLLRQVLFNLVLNAIDAMPTGGTITLGSREVSRRCVIFVEDEGTGIPADLTEQVFQSGFTTKRDASMSGLGLGLATCRSILEALGGTLTFQVPDGGRGTRFEAAIPQDGRPDEERSVHR